MSMLTGLYPHEHGVYPPDAVLAPEIPTLAEVFRRQGYRTAGFAEGGYVRGHFGFDRGFDHWYEYPGGASTEEVVNTFDRAAKYLEGLAQDDRFFVFVHTYTAHDPYWPPEPYRSMFWPGAPPPDSFFPAGPDLVAVNRGNRLVSKDTVFYLEALYDGGIRFADTALEGFFAELARLDLFDDTLIIITSDHGEEFLEHGKLVHEQIYHECLHVPLLVLHPEQREARRIQQLAQLVARAPTLFDLAQVAHRPRVSGRSLVPALLDAPETAPATTHAFAEGYPDLDRTVLWQNGEEIYQLLSFQPTMEDKTGRAKWISRSFSFDANPPRLELQLASFWVPRDLRLLVDGQVREVFELGTGWTRKSFRLPGEGGKHRVTLETTYCDSPRDLGLSPDNRCLSFLIGDLKPRRLEVYDLAADPGQSQDLSLEHPELERQLLRVLKEYPVERRTPRLRKGLSVEHEAELKALGYLQ
jgi:hypothetical protein